MHTGLCVPIQAIIVPLYCNEGVPNVGFRRPNITLLTVHIWLLIHFIYLCVYYSSYHSMVHDLAIVYRFCCTAWMIIYCYPELTLSIYHWLKSLIPDIARPALRFILRDNYLSSKIWWNIKRVIYQRIGDVPMNENYDRRNLVTSICSVWMEIIRRALCDIGKVIMLIPIIVNNKVLVLTMLTYHIANLHVAILTLVFLIVMNIYLDHLTFIEISAGLPVNERLNEVLELQAPIQCTDNFMDEQFQKCGSTHHIDYINSSQLMDEQLTVSEKTPIQCTDYTDKRLYENFDVQNPNQCTDSDWLIKYFNEYLYELCHIFHWMHFLYHFYCINFMILNINFILWYLKSNMCCSTFSM